NRTVKYSVYDKAIVPVYVDSVLSHNQNEILIRFDRSVMNYTAVDNKAFTAGQLSEFVKTQVIDSMNSKVRINFEKLEAFKVMPRMTTADSLSITRLGDTIKLDAYWATLSVYLPEEVSVQAIADSLNTLYPWIIFAERNLFGTFHSTPN